MVDIILKKREGKSLSDEEINYFVRNYTNGSIPDYQASALLMAIYFQGLDKKETLALTKVMIDSGETLDLSSIKGIKLDKHSTGGVGDKTTLVVTPILAAAGIPIAKLSGRGLGHTGGTIDKLEAISGFRVEMPMEEIIRQVKSIGIAVAAQTSNLVPADKKLYALRDVTATVENKSLIAASVMSKKLASGADVILLDVKCGDGAFMKSRKDAFALAKMLVEIGNGMGKKTLAVITSMEEPLGNTIGNSLEVAEAIQTLKGKGPKDLHDLCVYLSMEALIAAGISKSQVAARKEVLRLISSGRALNKLKQMVQAQGGNANEVSNPASLPQAGLIEIVTSPQEGYIKSISAEPVGHAAMLLGAGRMKKDDPIDLSAGIVLHKKAGEKIKRGEKIASLYTNDVSRLEEAEEKLLSAYSFSKVKPKKSKLILGKVK